MDTMAGSDLPTALDISSVTTGNGPNTSTLGDSGSNYAPSIDFKMLIFIGLGVVLPIICMIGVITNAINIVILSFIASKVRTPTYVILIGVAISDLGALLVAFCMTVRFNTSIPNIREQDIGIPPNHTIDYAAYFYYHTWYDAGSYCIMTSNWCIVAVTAFRFIAIYFPLRTGQLCTKTRAKVTVIAIYLLALLLSLPEWLKKRLDITTGQFLLVYEGEEYSLVYTLVMHTMPWCLSIILVGLLVGGLHKTRKVVCRASHQEKSMRDQKRLSVMLIAIVAWFICCTCPSVIYFMVYHTYGYEPKTMDEYDIRDTFYVIQKLGVTLNHASNFFFYTIINKNYRSHFCGVVTRRKSIREWAIGTSHPSASRGPLTMSSIHSTISDRDSLCNSNGTGLGKTHANGDKLEDRLLPHSEQMDVGDVRL